MPTCRETFALVSCLVDKIKKAARPNVYYFCTHIFHNQITTTKRDKDTNQMSHERRLDSL